MKRNPALDPSAAPAPAAGWRPLNEAAVAVQQVNATVLDGRIWVAGGLTPSHEPTASTQFYDPTINSWGQGPPLPEPVHHAMLVTYRNQLAVIGGFHSRDHDLLAVTSSRMLLLDNNTGQWVEGPPLRHPRAAGGAAVVGNEIVVVGGRTGNPEQLVTQTEVYDGTRWRDAADIPVPGDHLAVTADSSYLYAVGGRKFTAGSNTDVVQRYDPKANRWTILTPTPQPVSGAGAAVVDGRLIVVGGEGVTTVSDTVQAYDLTAPPPPGPPCPPSPGPPRPRGHRHRQHPLRRRRRHQSRTHRIHQPRRSTHLLVTAPAVDTEDRHGTSTASPPSSWRPSPPTPRR